MKVSQLPASRGGALALLAATLFGASTPLVQWSSRGVGAFVTASLLYAGAAVIGLLTRSPPEREAQVARADLPRLFVMALLGAGVGPVALVWGLQHTSGTSASLLLTMEAPFTALLARLLYGESLDRRVGLAIGLLFGGGVVLVLDQGAAGAGRVIGLMAVLAATLAWGLDNTLSRKLAERDPGQVVLGKTALGAALTGLIGIATGEPRPGLTAALALLAIGATGYGLSLRCYLLAQRAFGAARTGSIFAFAPFIGAALAVILGDRGFSVWVGCGGALMATGIVLHLTESHNHAHTHEAIAHDHAHVHDDGHHDHMHSEMPAGPHSHPHQHALVTHSHAHVPDAHHVHQH